jgi:hypothetical protein
MCVACTFLISYICIPYFVSVTDRRNIIGDDDLSSASDSESVLEMFSIPPLGRTSQQQCQERRLSSFLYQTQPQTQRTCRPMKAYPTPAEKFLSALLSSPVMEELALDLQTMPMVSLVFCSLPVPILAGWLVHWGTIIGRLGFKKMLTQSFNWTDPLVCLTKFHTWY